MNGKSWLIIWMVIVSITLGILGMQVYKVDPYMHFHKPDTKKYTYTLFNQRSQNDGLTKYLDYDALITGTSMTENFKTSEMNDIFKCNSIKVPYSGGTYKEINDNLKIAVDNNPNLEIVVRGLDMQKFLDDKDLMREDLGKYPTYLYDKNPFNDVQYIWNRDVINRVYFSSNNESTAGITSFDEYSRWQLNYIFGINTVCPDGIQEPKKNKFVHLTNEEKKVIKENISQNVTSLAKENPNISFYYFFPPYSILYWHDLISDGTIYKQLEAEKYVIKLILECDNIKLFSFNNRMDITTDLNNYKDNLHYGEWVNSLILCWMHDGKYQITNSNYKKYLDEERNNYINFDYSSLNNQIDYENDFFAAALLNEERAGTEPVNILNTTSDKLNMRKASIVKDQYDGSDGIKCTGSLQREPNNKMSVYDYIVNVEYIGAKMDIAHVDDYRYLVFYGKKVSNHGQPTVYIIDDDGKKIGELELNYRDIDSEWHQYLIDITNAKGKVHIIFNGGYIDNTGNADSNYIFSNIMLY